MATINEISGLDSYVGNAALGGANEIAINIDTKPIQQLAAYTLMYNKSQYDQRQKDADEKIIELGKLTRFDPINGLPKDVDAVKAAKLKLQEISTKYASEIPGTAKEKQESYLKFQQDKAEAEKILNSANARDIKLKKYIDATQANKELSTELKELKIKRAEKLFNETDVYTLPNIPDTEIVVPKVGEAVYDKIEVYKEDESGNYIIDETRDDYSFTGNAQKAFLEVNDFNLPVLQKNATEAQKAEYEQKKLAFSQSKMGLWKDATQFYGEALTNPNYKKTIVNDNVNVIATPNGQTVVTDEVDVDKIKSANPLAGGIVQLGEAYNDAILKKIDRLEKQQYESSITGKKPLFSQGADTPEKLKSLLIDTKKPLSPEQLGALARFEQARPDKVDMKLTITGYGNDEKKMANQVKIEGMQQAGQTQRERLQQAGQNFRATLSGKGSGGSGGGDNTKETMNFMDLTGYKGKLTTADIAAIDPTLVVNENGIFKLNEEGQKAKFNILPNGDVEVSYKGVKEPVLVNQAKYQKESIAITQTVLKDRKGEEGNPFTFTGIAPSATKPAATDDSKLTDAEYYMKYKKARN